MSGGPRCALTLCVSCAVQCERKPCADHREYAAGPRVVCRMSGPKRIGQRAPAWNAPSMSGSLRSTSRAAPQPPRPRHHTSPQHFRPWTACSPKYNRASRVPARECRHAPLKLLSPALHTSIPNKWTPYLASPYAIGYFPCTCRRMRSENREPGTLRHCRVERAVGPPARRRGTTLVETVRMKWMSSLNPDPLRSPHPVRVVPDRRTCT